MEEKRNYFAGLAMQALIAKMPLIDQKGELGIKMDAEQSQQIKRELCESAWAYADWMIYAESKDKYEPGLKD